MIRLRPTDRSLTGTAARVRALLRELYAAPEDPAYWDRLESRIMARVMPMAARTAGGAWTVARRVGVETGGRVRDHAVAIGGWPAAFRAWARAGLAVACAAVLAAGMAAWASRTTEARVAYETVLDEPSAVPVLADTRFINVSEREATARYVLSH